MDTDSLKKLWQQTLHGNGSFADPAEWDKLVSTIYQCGKGLEETMRYLYQEQPTFEAFLQWVLPEVDYEVASVENEDVLTPDDILFFENNGYVVIKQALTTQQAKDAKIAVLEYLHASLDNPATWYAPHPEKRGMMVMYYHHPALEVARKSPRIKKAYEQLYKTTELHAVVDKVGFNPPETPFYKFMGSPLHWDVSLAPPIPFKLQGVLYLSDVTADGGAFSCVPGFNNKVQEWLANLPPGVNPREEAVRTLIPVPINGNAGDFIIWHQGLPHCATPNHSNMPRIVQYHTYLPNESETRGKWV